MRKSNDRMGPIDAMNFAAFDLNLLRVFDALMRERSATRAGERVGLSQPAVSAALGRLRHLLGDELFVRQGNEMVPTPRALALGEPLRDALARIEQALSAGARFDPAAEKRGFTLLGADFFSMLMMPDLSETVARAAPGITLHFLDSARGDVDRLLSDDKIDMAIERPLDLPDWVSRRPLFRGPFAVIAARGHPDLAAAGVREGEPVPLDLFCALPHALRSIDGSTTGSAVSDALAAIGRRRRVVLTLPQFHGVALAVARGRLLAAVPVQLARAVADELALGVYQPPIPVPVPEVHLYWHRRHDHEPAHRWLREQVVKATEVFA
ncbi:MAG: Transcriptional regulator, LysR family [Enhydrobacter sp.]|nr:MAG: Transcriptional regulator, LysR family [Enhydrobacter sp.]